MARNIADFDVDGAPNIGAEEIIAAGKHIEHEKKLAGTVSAVHNFIPKLFMYIMDSAVGVHKVIRGITKDVSEIGQTMKGGDKNIGEEIKCIKNAVDICNTSTNKEIQDVKKAGETGDKNISK